MTEQHLYCRTSTQSCHFYSFGYLPYWEAIVGTPLQPVLAGEMYGQQTAERIYAVIKHPAATGVTSAYFYQAGQFIRREFDVHGETPITAQSIVHTAS